MAEKRQTAWYARPYAIACLAAMAVLFVAGIVVRASTDTASSRPACASPEAQLAGVWDAPVRARIGRHADTATQRRLSDYARAWRDAYAVACADRDEARQLCLEARRADFAALTRLLGRGVPVAVRKAAALTDRLEPVAACGQGAQ